MPKASARRKKPLVQRVTVDERLDESLVRLLVAPLAEGVEDITEDRLANWEPEKEVLATRRTFRRRLGLPKEDASLRQAVKEVLGTEAGRGAARDLLWRGLKEGQVFLVGQFEVVGPRGEPEAIRAREGANDFLRIDRIPAVKESAKKLYSKALAGRGEEDA